MADKEKSPVNFATTTFPPRIEKAQGPGFDPMVFGNMEYKPELTMTPPVNRATGEPWRGVVKPHQDRYPFLRPNNDG